MSEYPYEFFSKDGKVLCQICGKPYLVISPRHLKGHNLTHPEYKLRFPDAPLSCEKFNAASKYGKEKNLFVEKELEKLDKEDEEPIITEMTEYDEDIPNEMEPTIDEEINFEKLIESNPKSKDICVTSKNIILDHLKTFFTNIKKDYMIQIFAPDNRLMFESISDFADPILKINIEFPNSFWHNRMLYDDPNRDNKLIANGWKVIKIKSKSPSFNDIETALKG